MTPNVHYTRTGILTDKEESKKMFSKKNRPEILSESDDEAYSFHLAKENVRGLLDFMGEDVKREGLLDTPRRVVEMYEELTSGYSLDPIAIIEKATIPTTTPAVPQIKACLAVLIFSGSPFAVKNVIPATTKQITAMALKINPTKYSIDPTIE